MLDTYVVVETNSTVVCDVDDDVYYYASKP